MRKNRGKIYLKRQDHGTGLREARLSGDKPI
jgi:hypothetical protein